MSDVSRENNRLKSLDVVKNENTYHTCNSNVENKKMRERGGKEMITLIDHEGSMGKALSSAIKLSGSLPSKFIFFFD